MKSIILIMLMSLSHSVLAFSEIVVNQAEDYAVILVQGDGESERLYNALNVAEEEIMGSDVLAKKVAYTVGGKTPVLIECDKIPALDLITCGISIEKIDSTYISVGNGGVAQFTLTDKIEAESYSENFNMNFQYNRGVIFQSDNGLLSIYAVKDNSGDIVSFYLRYN